MKTLCRSTVMALVLGGVFLAGLARSGDAPAMPKMTAEEQAAMMEWMKLSQPGEHHKHLDYFVGKWKTKTTMQMGGPGSDAMQSVGTSDIKWVLGGRFLMDEHRGSMMGMPYEGLGITGHDNFRNMYFTSWHSNMQTNVLTSTGARNPKTGNFTYYGEMDEPALGVVGRTVKYLTRIVDKDHYVFEIIDLHAGDAYKVIEIEYERVK
jgi:Protein of unknown function (DUF1579)